MYGEAFRARAVCWYYDNCTGRRAAFSGAARRFLVYHLHYAAGLVAVCMHIPVKGALCFGTVRVEN
jgi:hypothetical protein